MKLFKFTVLSAIVLTASAFFSGCAREELADNRDKDYGYVQFKLYKEASYNPASKSTNDRLEYLSEASKIKVEMIKDDQTISQTLTLTYSDKESAEFGLRSSKLRMLAGDYQVAGFILYDALDEELTRGSSNGGTLTITPGGLVIYDLTADVTPRGQVRFYLKKDISRFEDTPEVNVNTESQGAPVAKSSQKSRQYTLDEIHYADIIVRDTDGTSLETRFEMLPVEFKLHFADEDFDGNTVESDKDFGYQTSSAMCDTLLFLKAGNYEVTSYVAYDKEKTLLETRTFESTEQKYGFTVSDNEITDATVGVSLYESDGYIRDCYAIYEIWKALDGPNWSYQGESYTAGTNWDFNKDPDLWTLQPGVEVHPNGRVAKIDIAGFGYKGVLPAAIGDCTEIVELILGFHNENKQFGDDPAGNGSKAELRKERYRGYMQTMHPDIQMSAPCALALKEHNLTSTAASGYTGYSANEIARMAASDKKPVRNPGISTKDMHSGKLTNGLTGIDPAIGKLTKLENFSIANSPITAEGFPAEMANLRPCTDLEIYNCPNLGKLPDCVAKMTGLVSVNISNNRLGEGDDDDENVAYQAVDALANGYSKNTIQLLYVLQNNLRKIPQSIADMGNLSLLDLSYNNIHGIIEPFGESFSPVELHLSNNKIEGFRYDPAKKFCRTEDLDNFSANYNNLTEFPNIFTADTDYTILSISVGYNKISKFPENFQGVRVQTLTMSGNDFTSFPKELLGDDEVNSYVEYVLLNGCKISEWSEDCFKSKYTSSLVSFDLSYNNLTEFPDDFNANQFPYLYGVDISYNNFDSVPIGPLNCAGLTVYALRGQRDDEGGRILTKWLDVSEHKGLRGYYIGSNDLRKVTGTISPLIYNLDISDNPNITFDASNICEAWKQQLYILFYDKTQDIINCDEMLQ